MPEPIAAVDEAMPRSDQGETADSPIPAPKVNNSRLRAAAATPPANIAGHETAETVPSSKLVLSDLSITVSTICLSRPRNPQRVKRRLTLEVALNRRFVRFRTCRRSSRNPVQKHAVTR